MEIAIRTDKNGAGSVQVEGPVHDATIIRGWGTLTVEESTLKVTNSAPNDAVTIGYAAEPDHQLTCPYCLTPLEPHQICAGAETGAHAMHVRPHHIHHEDDQPSSQGHEQAKAVRESYRRHKIPREGN